MTAHEQIERWRADGTLERLSNAIDTRAPIKIRRSSGEVVDGMLVILGHGGLTAAVAWGDRLDEVTSSSFILPDGVLGKTIRTEHLLEANPDLRGDA